MQRHQKRWKCVAAQKKLAEQAREAEAGYSTYTVDVRRGMSVMHEQPRQGASAAESTIPPELDQEALMYLVSLALAETSQNLAM